MNNNVKSLISWWKVLGRDQHDPFMKFFMFYICLDAWMTAESQRNPQIAHKYKSLVVERQRKLLSSVLRSWQERGELRQGVDLEVAELLVAAPMLVYRVHWHPGVEPPDELVARLIDATLRGIAADRAADVAAAD